MGNNIFYITLMILVGLDFLLEILKLSGKPGYKPVIVFGIISSISLLALFSTLLFDFSDLLTNILIGITIVSSLQYQVQKFKISKEDRLLKISTLLLTLVFIVVVLIKIW